MMQVRITPEERAEAHLLAEHHEITLSDLVRRLLGEEWRRVNMPLEAQRSGLGGKKPRAR